MRIQIISQAYYPDDFRINDIAAELVNKGHTVKVLTGLPDYATTKIPMEFKWLQKRNEYVDGVQVTRLPIIARRKGIIFRTLNYLSFVVSSCLYAMFKKIDFDVIFVYQTSPIFQTIPAQLLKWRSKKKIVLYCCDLWPESIKAWNIQEQSLLFKMVKSISAWIYCDCDKIAITSQPFHNYLIDNCKVSAEKIFYVPQHAEDIYADICGQYEENGCIDFLFAGNIGMVQNVECILRAVSCIKTEHAYCVHIVGDGSEMTNCKKLAEKLSLKETVLFHGRFPMYEMQRFYKMADCFLLTLRGGDFIGMTLPGKAQGYLSAGKPIVAAIDGAGYDMMLEADCGEVVTAGDSVALAEKMEMILDNFEAYKKKGMNGRRFYDMHYTKEKYICSLLELLKSGGS